MTVTTLPTALSFNTMALNSTQGVLFDSKGLQFTETPEVSTMPNINYTSPMGPNSTAETYGFLGPLERFDIVWVAYYLNLNYLWVVFAFGFPGNLACLITILRMPPLTSSTTYVAALAITDNFAIINKLVYHQVTLHDMDVGGGGCKALFFLGSFFAMYPNWILVAMTVERFVAIWFPLNVSTICTKKKAVITLIIVALILLLADVWFLFSATFSYHKLTGFDCGFLPEYSDFLKYYWYWIDGLLFAILPSIILVIFNVLIIHGIRRSARVQKDLTNNKNDHMAEKFRQQRQITIMLVVVSVTFVILNLPNCIFFILKGYWKYEENTFGHAVYMLTNQIVFILSDSNNAINFYLYFLSARKFRMRFVQILTCRRARPRSFTTLTRTGHTNINVSNTSLYSAGNMNLGNGVPGVYTATTTTTNNNAKASSRF